MIVYKITNTVTGKAYIGMTTFTIEQRLAWHLRDAKRPNSTRFLHRSMVKHGPSAFVVEEIGDADSIEELRVLERRMVAAHRTLAPEGYNMTAGGDLSTEWCEDLRQEASETKKAWAITERGRESLRAATLKSFSPEAIAKRSESLKRFMQSPEGQAVYRKVWDAAHTPEAQAKRTASLTGRKCSDEHRKRMSETRVGRRHTAETKAKMAEARRKRWDVPGYRQTHSERMKREMADPEARERIRLANVAAWSDPEVRRAHSDKNPRKKLSDEQALEALARLAGGEKLKTVADRYGVSTVLLSQIRSGRARKHLKRAATSSETGET